MKVCQVIPVTSSLYMMSLCSLLFSIGGRRCSRLIAPTPWHIFHCFQQYDQFNVYTMSACNGSSCKRVGQISRSVTSHLHLYIFHSFSHFWLSFSIIQPVLSEALFLSSRAIAFSTAVNGPIRIKKAKNSFLMPSLNKIAQKC